MLKSNYKNTLIVNSLIELGDDLSADTKGKGRKFVSRFIEAGVAHYEEFGDILITKETLDKFIDTMVGCPVIIKHKDIDDKNADKERVGVVSKVWYDDKDGWFYCEGIIWDKQAIDLVKNQGWNVSCTYDFDSDKQAKTHNGKKIDMEFTGGEFLHLALVPNPRYERANIVLNSQDIVENDHWITIGADEEEGKKGHHVLVKDGETHKEATERKVKEWEDKKEEKQDSSKQEKEQPKEVGEELAKYNRENYYGMESDAKKHQAYYEHLYKNESLEDLKDKYDVLMFRAGSWNSREAGEISAISKLLKEKSTKDKQSDTKDKSEGEGIKKQYKNLLDDPRVEQELRGSIKARKADDPNAKVGDTAIDSDRLISLYVDKLTPQEYKEFSWDKAEELIFDKLHKMEEEAGFKKPQDKEGEPKDITKEEHAEITEKVKKMSDDELVKAHFEAQKGYESETPRAGSFTKHEATYGIIAQELKKRTGRGFSPASSEREIREALEKQEKEQQKEGKKEDITLEGGIKETQDTYGRTTFTKGNKWANVHSNGGQKDSWIASYGLTHQSAISWEREKGVTEEQLLNSRSFKTEKGARKWALEQLKRLTSENAIDDIVNNALTEVIVENCLGE